MEKEILEIVKDGVIDAIFERGWVEQSPTEFLDRAKSEILPALQAKNIMLDEKSLNDLIFQSLNEELGDEFDVNIYRLKFFPSETKQILDV